MRTEKKLLAFTVEGGFITSLAREKLYVDGDAKKALELLLSCLKTDMISDEKRYEIALAILDGRAEIVGTYPGEDYEVIYLDEQNPAYRILDHITEISEKRKSIEKREEYLLPYFLEALRGLSAFERSKIIEEMTKENSEGCLDLIFECIHRELGELVDFKKTRMNPMLESFMQRMCADVEDDYGWLEPNGKFHPVEWGDHQKWATEHISGKMKSDVESQKNSPQNAGDFLMIHGWVLLHNPAQGVGIVTKDPVRELTKAQKEFLYDYYMKRGCEKEAMEVWREHYGR